MPTPAFHDNRSLRCLSVCGFTMKPCGLEKTAIGKRAYHLHNFFAPVFYFMNRWEIFIQTNEPSEKGKMSGEFWGRADQQNCMKNRQLTSRQAVFNCWAADKTAFTLCKFPGGLQKLWHIQKNKKSSFGLDNSAGRMRYPA